MLRREGPRRARKAKARWSRQRTQPRSEITSRQRPRFAGGGASRPGRHRRGCKPVDASWQPCRTNGRTAHTLARRATVTLSTACCASLLDRTTLEIGCASGAPGSRRVSETRFRRPAMENLAPCAKLVEKHGVRAQRRPDGTPERPHAPQMPTVGTHAGRRASRSTTFGECCYAMRGRTTMT